MIVTPIKTKRITANACTLLELLDQHVTKLDEASVVVVTTKIVSLCEGRVLPMDGVDKDELIAAHSAYYLPRSLSRYNVSFAITQGRIAPGAGIDESNGNGEYILWPKDVQATANQVRAHLQQKYNLQKLGVILTDSTTRPMQWGTTGIGVAHSGFVPLKDYIGTPDLFGRKFEFHKNNIMNGLAAAAVVTMGEGAESTPLAIIQDMPFVVFQDQDPSAQELEALKISMQDDLYAPLLQNAPWQKGTGQ
ncbi:MAG TPA: coenzyme F420-0:L-glutamate ligase [Nevskiaceae bacterium]|nr:coenzyme F420-0:L-glutamate ligase [Nevskiaceae bacterium]